MSLCESSGTTEEFAVSNSKFEQNSTHLEDFFFMIETGIFSSQRRKSEDVKCLPIFLLNVASPFLTDLFRQIQRKSTIISITLKHEK